MCFFNYTTLHYTKQHRNNLRERVKFNKTHTKLKCELKTECSSDMIYILLSSINTKCTYYEMECFQGGYPFI